MKPSTIIRAPEAGTHLDQPQEILPQRQQEDQGAGRVSVDPPGILGFLVRGRRSEPVTEGVNRIRAEQLSVRAVSGDTTTPENAEAASPARLQNECDYRDCAKDYRSFRASDCTYQPPHGGPRKICKKVRRPTEVSQPATQVQAQTRAQQCNLVVCARLYRSFDPSDCSYRPNSGGARRTCDR
jgi:BA14K-like protein